MTRTTSGADTSAQLSFALGDPEGSRRPDLPARLAFPVATDGGPPFDDDERYFEPWWPGAQAFLKREGDHIEIRSEHLGEPLAVFPELRSCVAHMAADGVIIEGTLLALDDEGRPDARLLRRRLTSSGDPAEIAEGAFVALDLPYLEARSMARQPFVERRRQLATLLSDSDHCVLGRGLVGEGRMLGRAVASLGLHAISARRLNSRWKSGPAGDAWLRLPVDDATVLPTRPFLVLMERLPLDE